MASFRNLLGLPVKDWDSRAAGQVLTLSDDKEHWEFGTGGGGTASPLTTKGDLYGYDTGNARIPVGTDGQVLVADSSQAVGVKWAQGNGIHIDDRVSTYANLPSPPTEGTGATYLVDADGLLYVWDGSSWPAEGGGKAIGGNTAPLAGAWRIFIRRIVGYGGNAAEIHRLRMYAKTGSVDLCTGGVAFASSEYSGTYAASNAFKSTEDATNWNGAGATLPARAYWIGYLFATPVAVGKITIVSPSDSDNTVQAPIDFGLQWSTNTTNGNDGDWYTYFDVCTYDVFNRSESRTYTAP